MTAQVLICVAIPLKWTEIGWWPPLILHTVPPSLFIGTLYIKEGGKVSSHRGAVRHILAFHSSYNSDLTSGLADP